MTTDEAVAAAYSGRLVTCSLDEYPSIRSALEAYAARCVALNDHIRAQIALSEVRRLDAKHEAAATPPTQEPT